MGIPDGMEGTPRMGMEHAESGNAPLFLGVSPVKIRTDHNGHTVTFYKKTEQYDTL